MRKYRPSTATSPRSTDDEKAPGCFRANGSWDPEETPGPESRIHASILGMVETRNNAPDLLPRDFVEIIRSDRLEAAFLNVSQWAQCGNWLAARATTSAERMVKSGGRRRVPNPTGEIPPVTPEIAAVLESITGRPVEVS